jgi:hypothetical protein
MSTHTWLEKAERLRAELGRLRALDRPHLGEDGADSVERVAIARWLRTEFSDEPAEDTRTLALFPDSEIGRRR